MYCCNLSLSTVYCIVSGEKKMRTFRTLMLILSKIIMIALNLKLKDE